jgi:hypothetical protein
VARAAVKKKVKTKKVSSIAIREHAKKDHSPVWEGHEDWSTTEFSKHFRDAMQYYNLEFNSKELKPAVLKWMKAKEYDADIYEAYKKTKDWRTSVTMGSLASCLLRGMPEHREDFNNGKDVTEWLDTSIKQAIERGKSDVDEEDGDKPVENKPSIQERVRDIAIAMIRDVDDIIETFHEDPEKFDPKTHKVINILKTNQVKAGHARVIKDIYAKEMSDYDELVNGTADDDLKEGYKHRTKKQIKNILAFYQDILSACDMLAQEAKVTRKPRIKKPVAKDKLISKLKFKKSDDELKLVSINPVDIIGAKELWVYNSKTRKLGRYVADDMTGPLNVKGTGIVGFDENKSIQKTIRKPAEKLKEFKAASKVALRKFLEDINATDTKMNGRINEEIVLLKIG